MKFPGASWRPTGGFSRKCTFFLPDELSVETVRRILDMNNKLNVQAIFDSIDGEENAFDGAGQLTTFIRLKGCSLRCKWCDTKYAQKSKPENWMDIDEIIQQVHFPKVTITGGEPLLQEGSVIELCNRLTYYLNNNHYSKVTIETNGTIQPTYFHADVRHIVDYKLPSSGMTKYMKSKVFTSLRHSDVIKFVISDEKDYEYAKRQIQMHPNWIAKMVFSPAVKIKYVYANTWGEFEQPDTVMPKRLCIVDNKWPRQLAEMMIRDKVDAQFSLQLHKILWPGAKEER